MTIYDEIFYFIVKSKAKNIDVCKFKTLLDYSQWKQKNKKTKIETQNWSKIEGKN